MRTFQSTIETIRTRSRVTAFGDEREIEKLEKQAAGRRPATRASRLTRSINDKHRHTQDCSKPPSVEGDTRNTRMQANMHQENHFQTSAVEEFEQSKTPRLLLSFGSNSASLALSISDLTDRKRGSSSFNEQQQQQQRSRLKRKP